MLHEYTFGKMEVCFMVDVDKALDLVDNGFDTLVLMDSGTGMKIEIEIMDLYMNHLEKQLDSGVNESIIA